MPSTANTKPLVKRNHQAKLRSRLPSLCSNTQCSFLIIARNELTKRIPCTVLKATHIKLATPALCATFLCRRSSPRSTWASGLGLPGLFSRRSFPVCIPGKNQAQQGRSQSRAAPAVLWLIFMKQILGRSSRLSSSTSIVLIAMLVIFRMSWMAARLFVAGSLK